MHQIDSNDLISLDSYDNLAYGVQNKNNSKQSIAGNKLNLRRSNTINETKNKPLQKKFTQ